MARSKRKKCQETPSTSAFLVNPFADLQVDGHPGSTISSNDLSTMSESTRNENKQKPLPEIYVRLAKKGRAGKTVTVLSGFEDSMEADIKEIAVAIRRRLGTGGTIYDETIEVQGDHRIAVSNFLRDRGFRLKGEISVREL